MSTSEQVAIEVDPPQKFLTPQRGIVGALIAFFAVFIFLVVWRLAGTGVSDHAVTQGQLVVGVLTFIGSVVLAWITYYYAWTTRQILSAQVQATNAASRQADLASRQLTVAIESVEHERRQLVEERDLEAKASAIRDLDETRRLLYVVKHGKGHPSDEVIATVLNSLRHHSGLMHADDESRTGYMMRNREQEYLDIWIDHITDRIEALTQSG